MNTSLTRRSALRLALLCAAMACAALAPAQGKKAPAQRKAKAQSKVQPFTLDPAIAHRREVYKRVGGVELQIDIFEPKAKDPAKKYPAIVFFFGGGWVGGAPSQFFNQCQYLALRGMIAMAADYRIQTRDKTTPAECVKDGKSAVRWVRANAERLGVDPTRIAAGGGSAGGHVAAAVANCPGFEEDGEDAKVSCRPDALVLFNPVFDNGPEGYGYDRVKAIFPAISPLHNLKPGAPPTIVFLGTADKLIPVATGKAYQAKMRQNGGHCELKLYDGQPHGFFNYGRANSFYAATLREADRFLASLGWLSGEPTLKDPEPSLAKTK